MQRAIIAVTGEGAPEFLQGLVTTDTRRLVDGGLLWAALLTPQGKYLADFFLLQRPGAVWIDADPAQADDLVRRLTMYRLRRPLGIERRDAAVARGTGPAPAGALPDPRHPALGWRAYEGSAADDGTDWDALRIALLVPEAGRELIPNESYILEAGFERLNGVDFRKGCYVGQEVTARMKHKAVLRRGLGRVSLASPVPEGTMIERDGREVGTVHTQAGGQALAMLRQDRVGPGMTAAGAAVEVLSETDAAS